jgi:hypothetical protein
MVRRCNLVEVEGDGNASLCEFDLCGIWCLCEIFFPLGAPLMALYMQPVRVYKVFLAFYSKSKCWALWASGILRAGFFLGRNRVGKYRGPRGHTLVTGGDNTSR